MSPTCEIKAASCKSEPFRGTPAYHRPSLVDRRMSHNVGPYRAALWGLGLPAEDPITPRKRLFARSQQIFPRLSEHPYGRPYKTLSSGFIRIFP